MEQVLLVAAAVLMLGTVVASAATNYVGMPHGFYAYHGTGLGNEGNQIGG